MATGLQHSRRNWRASGPSGIRQRQSVTVFPPVSVNWQRSWRTRGHSDCSFRHSAHPSRHGAFWHSRHMIWLRAVWMTLMEQRLFWTSNLPHQRQNLLPVSSSLRTQRNNLQRQNVKLPAVGRRSNRAKKMSNRVGSITRRVSWRRRRSSPRQRKNWKKRSCCWRMRWIPSTVWMQM